MAQQLEPACDRIQMAYILQVLFFPIRRATPFRSSKDLEEYIWECPLEEEAGNIMIR